MIADELLAIIVCPACRGELELEEDHLDCADCARRYPIVDGVPHLIVEQGDPK